MNRFIRQMKFETNVFGDTFHRSSLTYGIFFSTKKMPPPYKVH